MKRLIFIILLISLFMGSGIIFAENQGINYTPSLEKLVLVNPRVSEGIPEKSHTLPAEHKEYTVIKTEKLIKISNWIKQANIYMNQLIVENTVLMAEKQALEEQLNKYKKGLFIGGNVGLPLGGDAIIMYQFNKSGVYSQLGYQDGFNINIGYMRKIK